LKRGRRGIEKEWNGGLQVNRIDGMMEATKNNSHISVTCPPTHTNHISWTDDQMVFCLVSKSSGIPERCVSSPFEKGAKGD
jgi:hypothetical protein